MQPKETLDDAVTIAEYFRERDIVIVEDRPNMRRTLRQMVRGFGIAGLHIQEASDGRRALEVIRTLSRDFFVLLDLHLPQVSGIEVLKRLRRNPAYDRMPVILVSADGHEDQVGHAIEHGATGYIIKPFNESTLREKILNTINPPTYLVLFEKVEDLLRRDLYEEAVELAGDILNIKPGSPGALVLRGEGYEGMGRDDLALNSYSAAHRIAPIYMRVIKKLIQFHLERDNKAEALLFMEKADQLSPLNLERKMEIGRYYLELDRFEDTGRVFEEAVRIDPAVAGAVAELCLERRPELAEKYYRMSLAQRQDAATINQLGMALRSQGKWREAINEYALALRLAPTNDGIYFNMGRAYAQGGYTDEARRCFFKALDINPDLAPARKELDRLDQVGG